MQKKIIEYIKKNRVSSTEIADCLGKQGVVSGVKAINRGKFKVGNVFWVYAYGGSNWDMHEQIQGVKEGDVVFIEVFDCEDKAIFGDLVAKYLLLYRQASAIVVNGNVRDVPRLIKENWPIWCVGYNPVGCHNEKLDFELDKKIIDNKRQIYSGAIAVCDDTGVVIIPKECINDDFMIRMEEIEEQEDIWFDCIDRKKMSTFETVCLKKYL
ncbi:hypothetical protein J40TS1_47510 [Paenibacillus montaniterrae]|uniref:RraA family protein n=1 Tax=Paenibacillus montaniterrae TaxID=429341 RepID=A0A919YV92_9BACL|nr:RraA family protein [Paenibacillus montaniterrae]GIP19109.1 hypothetical protein J40TS1_47510 [Paenibacillus montaniterrae]